MMVKAAAQLAQVKKTHVRMSKRPCDERVRVMASLYSPRLVPLFTEGAASARKGPQLPPAEGNRAGLGGMASALLQMNVKNCTFTPLVAREEALL